MSVRHPSADEVPSIDKGEKTSTGIKCAQKVLFSVCSIDSIITLKVYLALLPGLPPGLPGLKLLRLFLGGCCTPFAGVLISGTIAGPICESSPASMSYYGTVGTSFLPRKRARLSQLPTIEIYINQEASKTTIRASISGYKGLLVLYAWYVKLPWQLPAKAGQLGS